MATKVNPTKRTTPRAWSTWAGFCSWHCVCGEYHTGSPLIWLDQRHVPSRSKAELLPPGKVMVVDCQGAWAHGKKIIVHHHDDPDWESGNNDLWATVEGEDFPRQIRFMSIRPLKGGR